MLRHIILICFLLTPLSNARAQAARSSEQATETRADGYWWRTQPSDFKLGFLHGYIAALNFVSKTIDPDGTKYGGLRFGRYTIGQIYDELEKFYADSANQHIQVYGAITWIKNKLEGTNQQDLQRQLEFLRREDSGSNR
jgi:type II restriction/modification system DNA methylase subunit YeeA